MPTVFNNPNLLSRGWYPVARSHQIRNGKAKSVAFFDFKVALFRRQSGVLAALYAYCPHMGADLGLGKVAGDSLLCPYHKWAFNDSGLCVRMAKKGLPPASSRTHSFPVEEKYGFVWIYNGDSPPPLFPEIPWHQDDHFVVSFPTNKVGCHPHVIGTNNPDFEHLETLHAFPIGEAPTQSSDAPDRLTYRYQVKMRAYNLLERIFFKLAGDQFRFDVTQYGANNITMDISAARYSLKTLISLTPTRAGTTIARFFLFVPKGDGLTKHLRLNLLRLPLLLASVVKVQFQDLAIYNNIRFKLPTYEPTMVRHAQMIETVGAFHPTDLT